jgi:hypothetical protein
LAFRVFDLSVTELTLFNFGDSRGLIQVRGRGSTFEPGFSRQIIRDGTNVQAYKPWTGSFRQDGLTTPLEITINKATNGKFQTFSVEARTGRWQSVPKTGIPWGVAKYTNNAEKFFEALGIKKTLKGTTRNYRATSVNFDKEGRLSVVALSLKEIVTVAKKHNRDFALFLDLEASDVDGYVFRDTDAKTETAFVPQQDGEEDESDRSEGNNILIFEVALGVLGGVMVIGVFTWWVYKRRSKKIEKEASTVSNDSSSDDCRHEELIVTVE